MPRHWIFRRLRITRDKKGVQEKEPIRIYDNASKLGQRVGEREWVEVEWGTRREVHLDLLKQALFQIVFSKWLFKQKLENWRRTELCRKRNIVNDAVVGRVKKGWLLNNYLWRLTNGEWQWRCLSSPGKGSWDSLGSGSQKGSLN